MTFQDKIVVLVEFSEVRKVTQVTERSTKRDLVEDTFGIHVQGTVSLQRCDKEWGEFVDVEIKDLKNRDRIKVMILKSCLHTRKLRSHAEQLCTPLTETSRAAVSICEGSEKAVDRLLQNLEDRKSSLEYRLQLAQATLTSLQEISRQGLPTLVNPSQTVSPARHFFNWKARGAWCPYMARLLFINPINIRLLNRGSI